LAIEGRAIEGIREGDIAINTLSIEANADSGASFESPDTREVDVENIRVR
jgi:hypothetical protein